jgi:hypothetical protein
MRSKMVMKKIRNINYIFKNEVKQNALNVMCTRYSPNNNAICPIYFVIYKWVKHFHILYW